MWELRSARFLAADIREKLVQPGDTVVDATLGNGHDTVALAKLVGSSGLVIGFDVQPDAVSSTYARLQSEGLLNRCQLHCVGHEHFADYVHRPVRYVSFNLGWLPGGNKEITTQWETTRIAVSSALNSLLPMGVCTVCAYPGHAEGNHERSELISFLAGLKPQDFNVLRQQFLNAGPGAPECFVIQRQTGCTYIYP